MVEWRHSSVFIVNFEHISHRVLIFLLLTWNRQMSTGRPLCVWSYLLRLKSLYLFTFTCNVLFFFLYPLKVFWYFQRVQKDTKDMEWNKGHEIWTYETLCAICYHLYNSTNVNNMYGGVFLLVKLKCATLVKVTLFHGCFSRFLNGANVTKSRQVSRIFLYIHTVGIYSSGRIAKVTKKYLRF